MKRWVGVFYRKHPRFCRLLLREDRIRVGMRLHPGKARYEVEELLWCELAKQIGGAVLASVLLGGAVIISQKGNVLNENGRIKRPVFYGETVELPYQIQTEEGWRDGVLTVEAMEYDDAEIAGMHRQVSDYLMTAILGTNLSLANVKGNLILPERLEEYRAILSWQSDKPDIVDNSGIVKNEELLEPEEVCLTAKVYYGAEYRICSMNLVVYPKEQSKAEYEFMTGRRELINQEKETRKEEWFVLPEAAAYSKVRGKTNDDLPMGVLACLGICGILIFSYVGFFNQLETREKKQKERANKDYREFVTKLSLMIASGATVRQAWGYMAKEYETRDSRAELLKAEVCVTERELENGCSEIEAYQMFGERMGIMAYQRLASLLGQYITKGTVGMQQLLSEVAEVTAKEREQVRVRAEEAGTKLLIPMMGLLMIVFAILLVPAFISF